MRNPLRYYPALFVGGLAWALVHPASLSFVGLALVVLALFRPVWVGELLRFIFWAPSELAASDAQRNAICDRIDEEANLERLAEQAKMISESNKWKAYYDHHAVDLEDIPMDYDYESDPL